MATVLVTGGAGYVGSHVTLALLAQGHECVVVDDLSNSARSAVDRVTELAGRPVPLVQADVRDVAALRKAILAHGVGAAIHLAGLKSVEESTREPLRYYDVNVGGAMGLAEAMRDTPARTLVFSSSACVYGLPERSPVPEGAAFNPENPYGRTKMVVELALRDLAASDPAWRIGLLRYFNPVGAHESGRIGESPRLQPRNLFPLLCRAAGGVGPALRIFGGDLPTPDGSPVRDYVHVMDVAEGHALTLEALERSADAERVLLLNLGTGHGISVREVIRTFESATGVRVPHEIAGRRAGDVPAYWADTTLAKQRLGWTARRTLDDMCRDAWRWQTQNPHGLPG